ncbi:hypothetical protein JTB14_021774 [Gonioctena quinquepunctata]|nr:hypothetical protein JTB14_021774 [Gonioctena quinquepunctata]
MEQECEEYFSNTTFRETDGRFSVHLHTKQNLNKLGGSYDIAKRRFDILEKKIWKNEEFRKKYHDFINEYIQLEHMSKLEETEEKIKQGHSTCLIMESSRKAAKLLHYDDRGDRVQKYPEKNAIEEEYNQRNKAKKTIFQPHTGKGKRTLLTAKGKGKGKGKKTKNPPGSKGKENQSEANSNSSDDEDYYCLVCLESFRNSAPNETWVQCGDCKNWSHAACIKDDPYYVCHNCESE